jgi:hypothetical protein
VSKSLLLISQLAEDKAFAAEVAAEAGLDLLLADDANSGTELVNSQEPAVIFVDVTTEAQFREFEAALQEKVGLFSDKVNVNAIHFLSSSDLTEISFLIQSPIFGHYLMRNYGDVKVTGQHYGRIVKSSQAERAFDLAALLRPEAKIQVVKLQSTSQKQEAVEAIKSYLEAAQFQSRMATSIANAVDELLMNAMFDAPIDELGKNIYSQTPRSTVFELKGKHEVEMKVGFDGNYIAVTAVDKFGSLDKVKLMKHIAKIYTDEEYKVKTSVAGAGLGLATVFHSGGSFYFVSESRTRTEVTVFFKRTESYRDFKDQFRFISTQFYF